MVFVGRAKRDIGLSFVGVLATDPGRIRRQGTIASSVPTSSGGRPAPTSSPEINWQSVMFVGYGDNRELSGSRPPRDNSTASSSSSCPTRSSAREEPQG